jgi:hypothetical protein
MSNNGDDNQEATAEAENIMMDRSCIGCNKITTNTINNSSSG